MKNIFTVLLIGASLLFSSFAFGQSPEKFSYQAVVRDASNNLLQNQNLGIRVSIIQGSASGTSVFVETQTPNTNANGLFTVEIGDGNVVSGDISSIDWENGPYFIKTEIDPTGGSNYAISGTSELLSVPFALHAKTAESITGTINYTETDPVFTASPAGNITSANITTWDNKLDTEVDGSITNEIQSISLSGQVITLSNGGGTVTIPSSNGWGLIGNASTNPATNFIGTTDNKDLVFRTNNIKKMNLTPKGQLEFTNTGNSVFIGELAGENDNTSNNNNVMIGYKAGTTNATGDGNTVIGYSAYQNGTANYNTAIGSYSLKSNTSGAGNTAVGRRSLEVNTTGSSNAAVGYYALYKNTTGGSNTGLGYGAAYNNTTGQKNVAVGYYAMYKNTTAVENTAIGYRASYSNLIGTQNTSTGFEALYSNTTSNNTAFGYKALRTNTTGGNNTAFGVEALKSNTNANANTAMGYRSLYNNTTGDWNSGFGYKTLYLNTTGYDNVAIGWAGLYGNTTGYKNTALGDGAFSSGATYHNSTGVGYNAEPGASNRIRLGNSAVSSIGGYAAWTNVSDGRLKTNVKENIVGLDFIMKLRPVSYNLDMDAIANFNNTPDSLRLFEDEALKATEVQTGFIAQEVEAAAQNAGFEFHGVEAPKNSTDHYGLRYAEFVVPLVKATQEQQETIKNLEQENQELKQALQELLKRVEQLENK